MSQADELVSELMELLQNFQNLKDWQKRDAVQLLVEKYLPNRAEEFPISFSDFQRVVSRAKDVFASEQFPIKIEDKAIAYYDQANYCMFVSVIMFLNSKELFKKLPTFTKGT